MLISSDGVERRLTDAKSKQTAAVNKSCSYMIICNEGQK